MAENPQLACVPLLLAVRTRPASESRRPQVPLDFLGLCIEGM